MGVGFQSECGALPVLYSALQTNISHDDYQVEEILNEILSNILVAPLDNLLTLLNESICIGPLRHVPDANYQANPIIQQRDWYDGKAAWDTLTSTHLLRDVAINDWLSGEDKLNLGYKLVYKTSEGEARYTLPTDKISSIEDAVTLHDAVEMTVTLSEEDLEENPEAAQVPISNLKIDALRNQLGDESGLFLGKSHAKDTRLTLWDVAHNIEVCGSDIGVGVSQLLPLVVATHAKQNGFIACEQPELHVHPRVQVAIGDLLTQTKNQAPFFIETHSEHLILRLLRRIRETTDNELPEGLNAVLPTDVSIVYMEPSIEGVKTHRIEIDSDGEFISRWPQGFFSERREELF